MIQCLPVPGGYGLRPARFPKPACFGRELCAGPSDRQLYELIFETGSFAFRYGLDLFHDPLRVPIADGSMGQLCMSGTVHGTEGTRLADEGKCTHMWKVEGRADFRCSRGKDDGTIYRTETPLDVSAQGALDSVDHQRLLGLGPGDERGQLFQDRHGIRSSNRTCLGQFKTSSEAGAGDWFSGRLDVELIIGCPRRIVSLLSDGEGIQKSLRTRGRGMPAAPSCSVLLSGLMGQAIRGSGRQ